MITKIPSATIIIDIKNIAKFDQVASMIGVESGHAIGSSLPLLRTLYAMGAR